MTRSRLVSPLFLALAALSTLAAGCFLPVSTAQPQSATSLGKGGIAVMTGSEFPTIDLVSTQSDDNLPNDEYGLAPLPTMTLGVGYGLSENLDLIAGFDSVLYIVLPLPLGAWVGGRLQLDMKKNLDVAVYARTGFVSLDDEDNVDNLRASYGQIGAIATLWPTDGFRPSASFSVMPAFVENTLKSSTKESFTTMSMNLTLTAMIGFGPVEVGPFVNFVYFRSPNLAGTAFFPTGGMMFSLRSRKARKPSSAAAAIQAPPGGPPPGPAPSGPPGAPR